MLHQIADNHVPVYYVDVLEVARNNLKLALEISELDESNNTRTPVELISTNIYDKLYNALSEHHHKRMKEKESEAQ